MRQAVRDVVYIMAVVVLSAVAALLIGWILSGCDSVDEDGDGGDVDTDSEPLECDGVADTEAGLCWDDEQGGPVNWHDAEASCASMGMRLPTVDEFANMLGGCEPYDQDETMFFECNWCEDSATCANLDWTEQESWTATEFGSGSRSWLCYLTGSFRPQPKKDKHGFRCVFDL